MAGLSEDLKVALCPKPCKGPITRSQRRLLPSGSVEITGEVPPPLCSGCPERANPNSRIRHLEVRFGFEARGDIGEVVDTESAAPEDVGIAVIVVKYDDPEPDPM
jgi:hypothetical protein